MLSLIRTALFQRSHFLRPQPGQIAVIVLLMMTVLLTIGLSVAQESSRRVQTATLEQEGNQLLNAAEGGVERALAGPLSAGTFTLNDQFDGIDVEYTVSEQNQVQTRVAEGNVIEVDVSGVTDGHNLIFNWSRENGCGENPAALLVTTYFDDAGVIRSRQDALRSCDRGDDFQVTNNTQVDEYNYQFLFPLQTDDQIVRVRPLYNDTHLRIRGVGPTWNLSQQFYVIRSTATRESTGESRSVEVVRTRESAAAAFDFALYSGAAIIK